MHRPLLSGVLRPQLPPALTGWFLIHSLCSSQTEHSLCTTHPPAPHFMKSLPPKIPLELSLSSDIPSFIKPPWLQPEALTPYILKYSVLVCMSHITSDHIIIYALDIPCQNLNLLKTEPYVSLGSTQHCAFCPVLTEWWNEQDEMLCIYCWIFISIWYPLLLMLNFINIKRSKRSYNKHGI